MLNKAGSLYRYEILSADKPFICLYDCWKFNYGMGKEHKYMAERWSLW